MAAAALHSAQLTAMQRLLEERDTALQRLEAEHRERETVLQEAKARATAVEEQVRPGAVWAHKKNCWGLARRSTSLLDRPQI